MTDVIDQTARHKKENEDEFKKKVHGVYRLGFEHGLRAIEHLEENADIENAVMTMESAPTFSPPQVFISWDPEEK